MASVSLRAKLFLPPAKPTNTIVLVRQVVMICQLVGVRVALQLGLGLAFISDVNVGFSSGLSVQ